MKKVLFCLLICCFLISCTDKIQVEKTVTENLKSLAKNPESVKIESMDVSLDTVPPYLTSTVLELAKETGKKMHAVNFYSDMSDLFYSEKRESTEAFVAACSALQVACQSAISNSKENPEIQYIAYVVATATNGFGGTVKNSYIYIVDKNNPKKILANFNVDEDFVKEISLIHLAGLDTKLETNQYGKFDTSKLPKFERFVFE